jgi:hypothetical protein
MYRQYYAESFKATSHFSILLISFIKTCHSFTTTSVPRITLNEYLSSPITHNRPILIRDIASPTVIEEIVNNLMGSCGEEYIALQHKQKQGAKSYTEIYNVTLQESIEYMMDSTPSDSYFAFCEGLLSTEHTSLKKAVEEIRDKPFPHTENWFDFFPSHIKPTDAIIVAGSGSTSTLHRDPFEWTGTSLCLEGTKLWRFIYPPGNDVRVVDEAFDSYRLDSVAWEEDDGDDVVLSAGWQSDLNLFGTVDDGFPAAWTWMEMEEQDASLFREELETMSSKLLPDRKARKALERIRKSFTYDAVLATAIQQTGDLLLIPAHCWHQTYAPVPSVAIASQRCSASVDGANVVRHIIGLSKSEKPLPEILKQSEFVEGSGRQVVDELLRFAIK